MKLYNTSNQLIQSELTYHGLSSHTLINYTYNTTGQLIASYSSAIKDTFIYSGTNLVLSLTYHYLSGTWVIRGKKEYIYNSANDLIQTTDSAWSSSSSSLQKQSDKTYTHNTNHQLTSATSYSKFDSSRSMYNYNSLGNLDNFVVQRWNANTSSFENAYKKSFVYNTSGKSTNCIRASWNGTAWIDEIQGVQGYVNPNQFEFHQMDWSGTAWVPAAYDTIYKLYYDIASVNINTPSAKNINCTIYPVPATSYIDIQLNQSDEQPVAYAIFSMQGQLISKGSEPAAKNITKRISVDGLANGQYVLYINNKKEELFKKFEIVK